MKALSSIVVGLDFSECSRVALGHALRIASWSRAALHPVHVVETNTMDYVDDESKLKSLQLEIHAGLVANARKQWAAFSRATPGAQDLPIDICVGSRLAGIRQQVARHQADLLVLGAYGIDRPNVGIGTVASGCIHGVPVDVLVVRDTHREPFRTVAVGIDFSEQCRHALEAAAFVSHHDRARLEAVHVAPEYLDTYATLRVELGPQLRTFVTAVTDQYPGLDTGCHVFPYSGHRSGLLEFTTQVGADLIAIGSKGRTNLHDVVLGSTAEKVLRDGRVAVWAASPTNV